MKFIVRQLYLNKAVFIKCLAESEHSVNMCWIKKTKRKETVTKSEGVPYLDMEEVGVLPFLSQPRSGLRVH